MGLTSSVWFSVGRSVPRVSCPAIGIGLISFILLICSAQSWSSMASLPVVLDSFPFDSVSWILFFIFRERGGYAPEPRESSTRRAVNLGLYTRLVRYGDSPTVVYGEYNPSLKSLIIISSISVFNNKVPIPFESMEVKIPSSTRA